MKIPVYQPDLSGSESSYVQDCLTSTWISSKGKYIERFETNFAKYIHAKYAAAVSNGTTALQTALGAMGVGPGDEVIVPTFTYISAVNTIAGAGATPVFVDSLADTWQMDPADVKRKITGKTKALVIVHLYAGMCDMKPLIDIAKEHDLMVVEDCAEATGSHYNGQFAGTFGDVACFSFFGNKTITTGEGGMVVTGNAELFGRLKKFKGQGLSSYREYWHDSMGFNYRMTNVCAAIGVAQMERITQTIERKRKIDENYRALLADLPVTFQRIPENVFSSQWMVSILLKDEKTRDAARKALVDAGVETRPLFNPVHLMPMYNRSYRHFPVAEDLALRGINLPSWPGLTQEDLRFVANTIKSFLRDRPSV